MRPGTKRNNGPVRYSAETLIKGAAREAGFSDAGIADIKPSPESDRAYDRWIQQGKHGEMRYLSGGADKRHDPGLLLPGARSVVSVALNYYSEARAERNETQIEEGKGVFSLYAHGRDYHSVLTEMLTEFDGRLRRFFPGMESAICVDTQPISERDLAVRAGIAWLGKNTMAISPEFGSWVFLGELVTNLELRSDAPLRSLCGSCTRCMDACPTGALDEAYTLDATKCISYLTIEKRGDIPREFHRAISGNLFGCDDCQRACPFNDYPSDSNVFTGEPPNRLVGMSLRELSEVGDEDFRELTRDSAIGRCKAAGLRRNARIVARNLGDTGAKRGAAGDQGPT
ncbi:MAG: tRNA epoxyqueuosine(34) reductase QueG [Candidatus Krumholzibacteriia bacterium]